MTELANAVAIIGLACRFPGAEDPRRLWANLRDGVESIRFFSAEELQAAGVDPALAALPQYVPAKPALDGIEDFDAGFFGFTPREAEILDPQQRLLLECAWHALEDAGCAGAEQPRNIGVYVGAAGSAYLQTHLLSHAELIQTMGPMALLMANDKDFVAAQIAYRLNLTGPAVGINTACSTSLVAIHQATAALLAYECDMALAGGASVKAQQVDGYVYQDGGVLSPDGHCRPFSDEARGTVGGSGAGLVLLKRLADAIEDGDPIYAVIAGSAINNDGADKLGMTAPSVTGQARAIREALAVAGFSADSIGYVEAHGTGTPLGDPVELAALSQAHGKATQPCAIGSVKSNFGHLDSAAGVAGLAKAALALQHGRIPATLHYVRPNPKFDFSTSRFFVADRLQDWPARKGPRRAAVSSFGIGGTNAHVVLQQAPESAARMPDPGWQALLLSGRDEGALAQAREQLAAHLAAETGTPLADAALTLATGRRSFSQRAAVVARDAAEAADLLRRSPIAARGERPARVAWLFAGQGSQHVGMAASLYREAPAFRAALQRCQAAFAAAAGIDLCSLLYPPAGEEAAAAARLAETANTQAAMFAVQYSLAEYWRALGAQPELLLGHSLGEYVAAVIAGVFSFDDAVKLVAARGRLIASLPAGRMAMAATSAAELRARLPATLSLCADNGPQRCVFGGEPAAVDAFCAQLQEQGIACRPLPTSHAFHSSQLDPVLDAFGAVVAGLALNPPRIPLVSSLSGELAEAGALCDPRYWVRHLRETVQMSGALSTLQQMPDRTLYLDLSPTGTLAALARHNGVAAADIVCALPREDGDARQACLAAAAQLWCEGVAVDAAALAAREGARRIRLPGYAFQRSRHWIAPAAYEAPVQPEAGSGPLHRAAWTRIDAALPAVPRSGARLLLRDRRGRAELLADADTVRVDIGAAWAELGPRHYQVAAAGTGRFDTLLGTLAAQGIQVSEVIFAAGLDEIADSAALAGLQATAAELLRACKAAWPSARLAWRTLLDAACQISGGDALSPWQRALASALSVVAQEEPNWDCRVLELGARIDATRLRELAAADFGRGHAQLDGSYWLSLRGRCLWTLRSQALAVPAAAVPARVVVIGALGSVAAQLCRAFARAGAQVSGLGRREAAALQGEAAQRLAALQADGIAYHSVDAADATALAQVLRAAAGDDGRLDLVVHAAADISVERMSAFADSDSAVFARQNRSKIDTSLALREAVAGLDVGAVVLMSSLAATLGGLGLGPYAGANGFQDALVEDAANATSGWYALAWDGLSADGEDRQGALFGAAEIAGLIGGIGSQLPPGHYLLARQGLAQRLRGERPAARHASPAGAAGTERSGYVAPAGNTEQTIATLYEELIGVRPVGARDHFFELGGDSLLATQLCSRLRSQCQVDLPIAAIFEAPVVADLAARVLALSAAGVQEDELAALVASLDALSPEQVQELLSG